MPIVPGGEHHRRRCLGTCRRGDEPVFAALHGNLGKNRTAHKNRLGFVSSSSRNTSSSLRTRNVSTIRLQIPDYAKRQ
jgi:hypothetical protein